MKLAPILLHPAWRYGDMTPWGGEQLHALFGKDAPGARAGESLELSALPGLESRDEHGVGLGTLIGQYGKALTGSQVAQPFPLLIKLIDARDRLSVQVHPDDAYASEHHGKLGKNEAWYILSCEPGSSIICGLVPGTTREALAQAAAAGQAIEGLLRKVPVQAGDTYYIPAGTVHAIGAGIVLYEIQQSSDITYRFYDWERKDSQGKARELHIDRSLDVSNLIHQPQAAIPQIETIPEGQGSLESLLDTPFFSLQRIRDAQDMQILPDDRRFSALTALSPASLTWKEGAMQIKAGQTVLLPAQGYPVHFNGSLALLGKPGY